VDKNWFQTNCLSGSYHLITWRAKSWTGRLGKDPQAPQQKVFGTFSGIHNSQWSDGKHEEPHNNSNPIAWDCSHLHCSSIINSYPGISNNKIWQNPHVTTMEAKKLSATVLDSLINIQPHWQLPNIQPMHHQWVFWPCAQRLQCVNSYPYDYLPQQQIHQHCHHKSRLQTMPYIGMCQKCTLHRINKSRSKHSNPNTTNKNNMATIFWCRSLSAIRVHRWLPATAHKYYGQKHNKQCIKQIANKHGWQCQC